MSLACIGGKIPEAAEIWFNLLAGLEASTGWLEPIRLIFESVWLRR